jgi:hypothetical protein
MSRGSGSCPSRRGAEGGAVRVRYLRQDPSWNTPTVWWYAGFWILADGAAAWPLALWSARLFLFRRFRRFDEPEEEDAAAESGGEDQLSAEAPPVAPAPVADLLPVPFRNKWSAAILFSFALSAAAIAANFAWFDAREKAFTPTPALPPPPPIEAPAPGPAAAPQPRGASAGNVANGSDLGFDGNAFFFGLWRNYDNPSAPPPGLYRFALDGSGRTPVGDPRDTEGIYTGIQVKDDWIYYIAMNGLCRIRKDGTRQRQLTKNGVSAMAVVGDWIYYQHKVLDGALFRMRLDGSGEKQLCREAVGMMCMADDGWIYYANKTDRDRLWRMKADGTARARLAERRVGRLLVAGGSIWFTDLDKNSALCRMELGGSGSEVVIDDAVYAINWADDRVYFIRRTGALARCKPDGSELETVAPAAMLVLVHGGYLFIRPDIEEKAFKRTKLDGSGATDIRF